MLHRLFKSRVRRPSPDDSRPVPGPKYRAARYAAQRHAGFALLKFSSELEREFRETFLPLNSTRIRVANYIGLFGILGFVTMDQWFGMNLEPLGADLVLLLVSAPAVMVPILATLHPKSHRHVLTFLYASALVVGLSIVLAVYLGRVASPIWFPYEALIIVSMYFYFVSGMLFQHAVTAGFVTWGAFVASNWVLTQHSILMYEAYYLLLANVLGAAGLYLIEYEVRRSFLAERELRQHAEQDAMTGALNRRAFQSHLGRAWGEAQRSQVALGLLLIDLDGFKRINDRHGHPYGDDVLCSVVEVLQANAQRPLDSVARYGGDEFIAVWYDVDERWFRGLVDELPIHVRDLAFRDDPPGARVTISGGAALVHPDPALAWDEVLRKADELLYDVKRNGGNGVRMAVLGREAEKTRAA